MSNGRMQNDGKITKSQAVKIGGLVLALVIAVLSLRGCIVEDEPGEITDRVEADE